MVRVTTLIHVRCEKCGGTDHVVGPANTVAVCACGGVMQVIELTSELPAPDLETPDEPV